MRNLIACVIFAVVVPVCHAQAGYDDGRRIVLTDGNELYSWCQSAQEVYRTSDDNSVSVKPGSSPKNIVMGAKCWAFISGVIESIPAGGKFDPDPDVRLAQYIDTVTVYLQQHPNIRQRPAAYLVRLAVEEAFPHRSKK